MKKILFLVLVVLVMVGCQKQTAKEQITGNVVGVEESVEINCEDSDGGINAEVYGEVSGTLDGSDYDFEDRCVGNILIEYSCEGQSYKSQNLRCDNKCEDGACE